MKDVEIKVLFICVCLSLGSPYNMAGTPGPLMSPGPNQDSMGYNMTINGSEYNSPQVCYAHAISA